MAQRFGGRFSPDAASAPPEAPGRFRNRAAARVSVRARLMFLWPLPLLGAGIAAIGRGNVPEMLATLGGFAALMFGAWLLNEGLRAEAAYAARAVARPPAIPRKLFAAVLGGAAITAVGIGALGQGVLAAAAFGIVAALAQVLAFGLDPMKKKGIEGIDASATDRVARAIDQAEALVRDIIAATARIGDKRLEGRIERLCDQARDVFRVVEQDPRDLTRARTFLHVYLRGLRDSTIKYAELQGRSRNPEDKARFETLVTDLETSFTSHRADLLADNRSDLEVEIEVLRERLKQDGLVAR